jgi:peptidoglycan/xylan/chitin deacetylase (PgdA/CDA1 family)
LDSFKADFEKIRNLVKEKAGVECSLYRFPGGSSNSIGKKHIQEFIGYLDEEQIVYFDWNVSSKDATGVPLSVDEIVQNSTADLEKYRSAVILFHDSATKYNTVQALPKIIETIQAMENTEIVPITETSVPVQQIKKEE